MDKIKVVLALLGAINKVVEAKADDGKIDAQEVIEIIMALAGGTLGLDLTKLQALIDAIEGLLGEKLLSKELGFLG